MIILLLNKGVCFFVQHSTGNFNQDSMKNCYLKKTTRIAIHCGWKNEAICDSKYVFGWCFQLQKCFWYVGSSWSSQKISCSRFHPFLMLDFWWFIAAAENIKHAVEQLDFFTWLEEDVCYCRVSEFKIFKEYVEEVHHDSGMYSRWYTVVSFAPFRLKKDMSWAYYFVSVFDKNVIATTYMSDIWWPLCIIMHSSVGIAEPQAMELK